MDAHGLQAKAVKVLTLLVFALLALLVLQLWWNSSGDDGKRVEEKKMRVGSTEIKGGGGSIRIGPEGQKAPPESEQFRRQEMERLIQIVQSGSDPVQRRSAALRLQYMADAGAEAVLLRLLQDSDEVVAQRCSKALLSLWQQSDSPSVDRLFHQGLEAYEDGNNEEALARFAMCEELGAIIPDLPRLRAEMLLDKGKAKEALEQCKRAVALKKTNFMAHYVMARCCRALGDKAALASVDRALSIYPGFAAACQLRVEILSLQKDGGL